MIAGASPSSWQRYSAMNSLWPRMPALLLAGLAYATAAAGEPPTTMQADDAGSYQIGEAGPGRRELFLQETDFLWRAKSWREFEARARELAEQSLRLIDVDVHVVGDEIHYVGVWRPGSGGFALWTCPSWDEFSNKWRELSDYGLQLVDIEVYRHQGETHFFGLFREDADEDLGRLDEVWNETLL